MFPMTNYTITLKSLIDSNFDIGLKDYPIWSEEYREILNKKIIDHYLFREIGQETPALFKHYLNTKMNEIMPYYNKLYETTVYEYNPLNSADYTIEYTKETEGSQTGKTSGVGKTEGKATSTTEGENTTNMKSAHVDTPQSQLEVEDVDNLTAATSLDYVKDKTTNSSSGESTDSTTTSTSSENEGSQTAKEIFKQHLVGDYGVKSTQALIKEQREILINVDMMIIEELNSCFMQIF